MTVITKTISNDESIHEVLNQCFKDLDLKFEGKILIKPNLCSRRRYPVCTDVKFMHILLGFMTECEVVIVESDNHDTTAWERYEANGFFGLARFKNVALKNISEDPEILMKHYDFIISVANLKSHCWERFSGICKNMWGCLPQKHKERHHPYFAERLSYLLEKIKPTICIIDGRIGIEGWGPIDGKPKPLSMIIVGNDPVETDFEACSLVGIDPYSVPHLKMLSSGKRITVNNHRHACMRIPFQKPPEVSYKLMRLGLWFGRYRMFRIGTLLFAVGSLLGGRSSQRRRRIKKFRVEMQKHLYDILQGRWFF